MMDFLFYTYEMKIVEISIPEYIFDTENNPYFFDESEPKSLEPIAEKIEANIRNNFAVGNILIRGIQSGHHTSISKEKLVNAIMEDGNDIHNTESGDSVTLHAAPFGGGVVTKILEAFHMYKPKGQERPQYPVDIWMIFNRDSYDNIEYLHPRHKVVARDKWRLHKGEYGLLGLIDIN